MKNISNSKGWRPFVQNLAQDSRLWLWFIFLLTISRLLLFLLNRHSITEGSHASDYLEVFWIGFRFDMPVATIFTLPSLLLTSLTLILPISKWSQRLKTGTILTFNTLWLLITASALIYFNEFNSLFNAHMLGILYDDQKAILLTLWNSYPILPGSIAFIVLSVLLFKLARLWVRFPYPFPLLTKPRTIITKAVFTLLLLSIITLGLRGSWGRRPMQAKDANRTPNRTLNHCVINPFTSLIYAIKTQQRLLKSNGLKVFLKDKSTLKAFQEFAHNPNLKTVDEAFLHTAKGSPYKKPRHIFLIVMESYDGWTMLEPYAQWNVSNELKKLASNGIYVRQFLSGSSGTMTSLATFIAGMADAGVTTNHRSSPGSPPFATAIAPQMQKLGYETHFYYAGYGGWQRIEDFCHEQGFQHTHMAANMDQDADTNEWGVSDKQLFSYIKKTFNPDTPTFNIIMTSSNHPPYSLDLKKEHCPITSVPKAYQKDFSNGTTTLKMLGHHWYSDKWMGDFVHAIEKKAPNTLFAITGDHWNRKNPRPNAPAYERAIVPLVLYGPNILPKNIDQTQLCGSHYDLNATFIEFSAPKGFPYFAIGRNILTTTANDVAISNRWLLSQTAIARANNPKDIEDLQGNRLSTVPENIKKAHRQYQLMHAVSWWRLVKGNQLPKQ